VFGVEVPTRVPDVPDEILNPRNTWRDKVAYDEQARKLALMFVKNFEQFAAQTPDAIRAAAPNPAAALQPA
ncbi:MAG: phosphoenolpyruvate carboxykinase (ATP), partial [Caldilineaceae bacterium]